MSRFVISPLFDGNARADEELFVKKIVVADDLAGGAAGVYRPHQAVIMLDRDSSFWAEENAPTLLRFGIFLHEYVHYLHNFSTMAGIYDFLAQLDFLRAFMRTVGADGRSRGKDVLDRDELSSVNSLIALRTHLMGETRWVSIDHHARNVEVKLAGYQTHKFSAKLGGVDHWFSSAVLKVLVKSDSSAEHEVSFKLGSHILMEGLAWEVECLLFEGYKADVSFLDEGIRTFPYKLPRIIFEHISGLEPSSEALAKVILLALQTGDPGDSFLAIAEEFQKHAGHENEHLIFERVASKTMSQLGGAVKHICEVVLPNEAASFANRGSLSRGISELTIRCRKLISARAEAPFFELDLIANVLNEESMRDMFATFPSCPVMHKSTLDKKAEYFHLSETEPDEDVMEALGVTQCLMQFANMHMARGFVRTDDLPAMRCLFQGVCAVPQTQSNPKICELRPWESFTPSQKECCWFGYGILAARSRADLT